MQALRKLRQETGLSGYALAHLIGMTTTGYYALERGDARPTHSNLITISKTLADRLEREAGDVLIELTGINEPKENDRQLTPVS